MMRPWDSSRCRVCRATAAPMPEPAGDIRRAERTVRACVSRDEIGERIHERLEEGGRDADGQRHPECIAQASGILDRGHPGDAADHDADRAPRVDEFLQVGRGILRGGVLRGGVLRGGSGGVVRRIGGPFIGRREPRGGLVGIQWSEYPQEVGDPLDAARSAVRIEPLHLALELGDDVGVEKLSQLDFAEEFAQEGRVDR